MDLVPRSKSVPAPTTGYRDQNAALARDLAPIAQITGKELDLKTLKGDYLGLEIDHTNLVAVCRFLRDQLGFDLLSSISGVDMLDHLETVYHLRSLTRGQLLQIKVRLDHEKPEVDSVVSVWQTANWLERMILRAIPCSRASTRFHSLSRSMQRHRLILMWPLPENTSKRAWNMWCRRNWDRVCKNACIQARQPLATHLKDIRKK